MRLVVGLIGLLLALAIVAVVLRKQLQATPSPAPAAAGATVPAAPPRTLPSSSRQLQRQVADDVARTLEQGARRDEGEGGR